MPAGPPEKRPLPDARRLALSILNSLDKGGQTLDALLEAVDQKGRVDQRERGFLNALVFGVLRWRGRLDWVIGHFSKTPLKKIDPKVLNILRLGLFQILYMDRVPASAAVNTAVEMTKKTAAPWVVKFVNAVLRKMARSHADVPGPATTRSLPRGLAAEKSLPEWLVARWLRRYGEDETRSLCDAVNEIPATTIRANQLKTTRDELSGKLVSDVARIWSTPHAPQGISFTGPGRPIGEMAAFRNGEFQVQDEAAQLVVHLLGPRPGEEVLDACAGLGGKTGHMAQLMENRGRIMAMDINGEKLGRLDQEMHRLGVGIVETMARDLTVVPKGEALVLFDRILVDAPCSGLGVIRRNPDTKWSVTEKDLVRCQKRQLTLLKHLAPMVRPGGVMAYVVCSTEPEENEEVVDAFLAAHADFSLSPPEGDMDAALFTARGCFCTLPHRHRMDGFFCARFRRSDYR